MKIMENKEYSYNYWRKCAQLKNGKTFKLSHRAEFLLFGLINVLFFQLIVEKLYFQMVTIILLYNNDINV